MDIGSSEVFVQNFGRVNDDYEMYVKSALFCLYEMNSPIPRSVIQKFAEFNVETVLTEWLIELSKYQDELIRICNHKF